MEKTQEKNLEIKNFIKEHKIKFIFTLILGIVTIILFYNFFTVKYPSIIQKSSFEKQVLGFANINENTIFSIDEITLFSSCDAKNKVNTQTHFTIENLYAYTDIAMFINNSSDENTLENTLKEVRIENIEFTKPELGQAKLFYKDLNTFAKTGIPEVEALDKSLDFKIISEETKDFSEPVLYNNCANPITLSFVNENIKPDFTIVDTSTPITYNGSLLKRCAVSTTQIAANLSFDVYITNNLDQKFKSKVFINIPYQTEDKSIYDGNITIKQPVNSIFYRYE